MQTTDWTPPGGMLAGLFISVALALNAGYVDAVRFVALLGLFTAHVTAHITGSFVLIGSELANPTHGALIKSLAFPAFIVAVAGARLIVLYCGRSQRNAAFALLLTQALFLIGFMGAGMAALSSVDEESVMAVTAGVLGAAAMGVQSAASRLVWASQSPTTAMHGNVTQLVIDYVDLVTDRNAPGVRPRLTGLLWPVLGFGTDAILGAFAFRQVSFFAPALPVVLVGGVAVRCVKPRPVDSC